MRPQRSRPTSSTSSSRTSVRQDPRLGLAARPRAINIAARPAVRGISPGLNEQVATGQFSRLRQRLALKALHRDWFGLFGQNLKHHESLTNLHPPRTAIHPTTTAAATTSVSAERRAAAQRGWPLRLLRKWPRSCLRFSDRHGLNRRGPSGVGGLAKKEEKKEKQAVFGRPGRGRLQFVCRSGQGSSACRDRRPFLLHAAPRRTEPGIQASKGNSVPHRPN